MSPLRWLLPALLLASSAVHAQDATRGEYLVRAGAALLVQESVLTPVLLAEMMSGLLGDRAKLARMGEAARSVAWNDAAGAIAEACLEAAA